MLKTLFNQYKWYAVAILFLIYSIGVWNISGTIHDVEVTRERLRNTEEIIKIKQDNEELLAKVTKEHIESLGKFRKQAEANNKGIMNELAKDKRYTDCTVTDGVRNLYERKLQAQ